jgi:hypothetical protein
MGRSLLAAAFLYAGLLKRFSEPENAMGSEPDIIIDNKG